MVRAREAALKKLSFAYAKQVAKRALCVLASAVLVQTLVPAACFADELTDISSAQIALCEPGAYVVVGNDEIDLAELLDSPSYFHSEDDFSCDFELEYTGEELQPVTVVKVGDTYLSAGTDYSVEYASNVNVGTALVTITGMGSYAGTATKAFEISDTKSSYAFLYSDGTLVFQKGSDQTLTGVADNAVLQQSFFSTQTFSDSDDAQVPWAEQAQHVSKVVFDRSFDAFEPTDMSCWFKGFGNLTSVTGLANLDASACRDMSQMFAGCENLTQMSLSNLSTSKVRSFAGMFQGCASLQSLDISSLNTSGASNFVGMLEGCEQLNKLQTGAKWTQTYAKEDVATFPATMHSAGSTPVPYAAGQAIPNGKSSYEAGKASIEGAQIVLENYDFEHTGQAIEPEARVYMGTTELQQGIDYELSYQDNVNPGKAKVLVTGMGLYEGSAFTEFAITSEGIFEIGDKFSYKTKNVTYTIKIIKVKKTKAEAAITGIKVKKSTLTSLSLPNSCTVGNTMVDITAVNSKLTGKFRNVTTVIIGSKVVKIGKKAFSQAKKVRKLKVKSARITSTKNALVGSNVTKVQVLCGLTNARKKEYKKLFTTVAGKPKVKVTF